ncbi:hypothetical protein TRM7557_03727 [Tritonibacter multivorans]|uniref:Tellurium resistance protein n=1 Tax=Tritonibacter multivorans TaxID=928856 RepID=A0A0P1GJ10_9RHOB|nr:TrgA family protein [Tritonibacter multivorans]MDA7421626.1 TrgA family protein [Tritonibacter multivorans]CUH82054.1 hypothetical protein TRM7557_03727 [Tritonibacter multivorans]SFC93446.1 hypothetical protein SAMN04488049_10571 [Tritonibacter multivorans]
MPTAARLVAALSLAALAYVVTMLLPPLLPEGTNFSKVTWVNVGLGVIWGWWLMGTRIGRGFVAAVNNGVTGAAVLMLSGLFVQGAAKMFNQAHRRIYDDPFEALADIFVLALDYFFVIAVPHVLITLLIGGVLSGLLTENAGRRWR